MNTIKGSIVLVQSDAELFIPIAEPISQVYLSTDDGGIPCCGGSMNWTSGAVCDGGFVIFADIQSASCVISYLLILE